MSIPPTKPVSPRSISFSVLCALTLVLTSNDVTAENLPLPVWEESDARREPDASLFPSQGDIFQGGNARPEMNIPSSMFDPMPSAPSLQPSIRSGAAANLGAAVRNFQTGNPLGAFQAVGAAGSQVPSALPAVGQIVGGMGGALPGGAGDIARAVQTGAQAVGAVNAVGSMLGQFQRGGSGAQNIAGAIGNAAGVGRGFGNVGQGFGNLGQGGTPSLQGILQGLGGGAVSGAFGNGIGAGPFGQFMGQNNQIMQGMQFIALLQQLFGMFFPADSALQFNNANTGQSARTAFANLMGANAGSANGFPSSMPTGACDNSAAYQEQYQRVYDALEGSSFIGTVPEDGAQYGITTGSREEWANFFTRLARVESGFNPNTAADTNGRREGTLTSFGVYQMGQSQFNTFGGGNIYNATDNTNAFVRYAESMYFGTGSYGAGGGQNRLAGRSGDRWLGLSAGYGPLRRTLTGSQNANESFLLASNAC